MSLNPVLGLAHHQFESQLGTPDGAHELLTAWVLSCESDTNQLRALTGWSQTFT